MIHDHTFLCDLSSCPCVCLSVCLCVCLSVCLSHPFSLYIFLSFSLICLSIWLYPSISRTLSFPFSFFFSSRYSAFSFKRINLSPFSRIFYITIIFCYSQCCVLSNYLSQRNSISHSLYCLSVYRPFSSFSSITLLFYNILTLCTLHPFHRSLSILICI